MTRRMIQASWDSQSARTQPGAPALPAATGRHGAYHRAGVTLTLPSRVKT
jgi:hypothetical protein